MGQISIVGGHVALDLVNTVDPRIPGRQDGNEHLATPLELLAWAHRVGLVTREERDLIDDAWARSPSGARRARAGTIQLREALYSVLLSVMGSAAAKPEDASIVMRQWARSASRSTLDAGPSSPQGDRLFVGSDVTSMIPDRLAQRAVDLVRHLDTRQLKVCPLEEGGCGWVFLDQSRNGSRRWCSMEDCGGRAKARRLTDRRRRSRVTASR